MQSELQHVFDNTPPDDPRSRLEPYRELILKWKRQGRSYRRISELMAEKFAVQVAYATVFGFVQRRTRPRRTKPEIEVPTSIPAVESSQPTATPKLSAEARLARRDAIRAQYHQPASDEKPVYRFEFDEGKPITNKHHLGEKNGNSTANG